MCVFIHDETIDDLVNMFLKFCTGSSEFISKVMANVLLEAEDWPELMRLR